MNYEAAQIGSEPRYELTGPEAPRRRRRWIIAAIVVVLIAGGAFFFLRGGDKAGAPAGAKAGGEQLPSVSVAVPGRHTVARIVTATGNLAARREMPVGVAGEGGMVTRVLVEPGQWVGAGQVLATVDRQVQAQTAQSLAAQINVARADAEIAQQEYDRAQQLVDRGFISKADLQRKGATLASAQARVRVAQAGLSEQRARNGRLDIRAPAAGLVLTRAVEPGQIVSSGSGTLFRMAKGGEMEMRAQLAEGDLAGLRVGAQADVTPVGSAKSFRGQVWQVSPIIDPQTRQGIARIALKFAPELRPGGFAQAAIRSGAADLPQLPNSAIQSDAAGNFVYVIGDGDKVVRRAVTVGEVSDAGVSIASGLTGQERVVLSAGAFLSEGQKVKPVLQKRGG